MNTKAIAITPNMSGASRRVMIRLLASRSTWEITCPPTAHPLARKKRCLRVDEFIDIFDNGKPHDGINKKLLLFIGVGTITLPDQSPVNINHDQETLLETLNGLLQAVKHKAHRYALFSTMRIVPFLIADILAFLKTNRHIGNQPA